MAKSKKLDITEVLLQAHDRSIERALEVSIRTGTALVVEKNGKIVRIPPKYKYVRVPIRKAKKR